MAFGLAGGLSKSDWCRLELYGWPWHSALVSEHCIGRGVDCWGSEIWTIAFADAENKYNGFRLICFSRSNWKTCSWYRCCWEGLLFSLWFSHLVRIWNQTLKLLESRNDNLISDLELFAFWALTKSLQMRLKFGSDQDGCFTSSDVAMGNYQLA